MAAVGIDLAHGAVGDDDVVGFGAIELMQTELGFDPVDAVFAFGVATE